MATKTKPETVTATYWSYSEFTNEPRWRIVQKEILGQTRGGQERMRTVGGTYIEYGFWTQDPAASNLYETEAQAWDALQEFLERRVERAEEAIERAQERADMYQEELDAVGHMRAARRV